MIKKRLKVKFLVSTRYQVTKLSMSLYKYITASVIEPGELVRLWMSDSSMLQHDGFEPAAPQHERKTPNGGVLLVVRNIAGLLGNRGYGIESVFEW